MIDDGQMDFGGYARRTDPQTAHDAAKGVNVTKGEERVVRTLKEQGRLTQQEVGKVFGKPADHLGPRFISLVEKRIIRVVMGHDGKPLTRAGDSGRQRQLYEYQPDKSLWRPRPKRLTMAEARDALAAKDREIERLGDEVRYWRARADGE